ncbi:hypothetical protein B0H16DRAFT_1610727 [Mycena metata]|uniref:Uncharacterized protein n=1 Tax=Mycena metata TaxID=1033252 RepID=A0AAD7HCZ8_9AGAR|nr:hypothetical protein B0H16DRAFT_1610727 [Mycena metata]
MAMPASDPTEVLGLARLLHSKVKELERGVAERKARRSDWRTAVDRLDKSLVALKAQEAKEGEKLAKLTKRWNKAAVTGYRNTLGPAAFDLPHDPLPRDFAPDGRYALATMADARRYGFDLPRDSAPPPPQGNWFVCPTTQAASAFNGNDERYMDTYTFAGSAWQAPSGIASPCSSPRAPLRFITTMSTRGTAFISRCRPRLWMLRILAAQRRARWSAVEEHRAAFADIRNTPQDTGIEEGKGRNLKRKSFDWEVESKMKVGGLKRYGSGRDERNGKRWSLRRNRVGQVA